MQTRMILKATLCITRNNVHSIEMYLPGMPRLYNQCGVKHPMVIEPRHPQTDDAARKHNKRAAAFYHQ